MQILVEVETGSCGCKETGVDVCYEGGESWVSVENVLVQHGLFIIVFGKVDQ